MWWECAMLDEKKETFFRKGSLTTSIILYTVYLAVLKYTVLLFFVVFFSPFAVFVLLSFFPVVQNYNRPIDVSWTWLSTEIGASVAEHAQGSLITPAVIDKNKRNGEGRKGERQEFHWATTKNTVKSSPHHHHSHHIIYGSRSTCLLWM